jgi:hypothetical protein
MGVAERLLQIASKREEEGGSSDPEFEIASEDPGPEEEVK